MPTKEARPAITSEHTSSQHRKHNLQAAVSYRSLQSLSAARLAGFSAAIVALAVYLLTLAPDLTWAHVGIDGAELITAAVTLGVPHPPGYPTYVLLGKLFSFLPLGSVAFRFNLFSALCTAAAAALLAVTAYHWLTAMLPEQGAGTLQPRFAGNKARIFYAAVTSALTFALLPLVWRTALVAEVYSLNLLFISALLWALFRPQRRRRCLLNGFLLGICLTTHLTSGLLAPLVIALTPRRQWSRLIAGTLVGLVPLLLLPLLAQSGSPVVWGQPTTLEGWWWLASGRLYQPNVFALPLAHWNSRLLTWSRELSFWFLIAAVPMAVLSFKLNPLQRRSAPKFLLFTVFLYGFYAFTYRSYDAIVFLLPALLLLNLLLARLWQFSGPVVLLLPLTLLMLNYNIVNLSNEDQVRLLAEPVLREVPHDALLFTEGDETTFTLWYLQYVEGKRQDIVIVDQNLFAFDWYRKRLQKRYPLLVQLREDNLTGFREANTKHRPWCTVRFSADSRQRTEFICSRD